MSRTTLHYYCTGRSTPKEAVLFRLEQAERQAVASKAGEVAVLRDRWLPKDGMGTGLGSGGRTVDELARHLGWLRGARSRQEEVVLAAQRHLQEIEGWVREAEGEVGKRQEAGGRRQKAERGERRAELRDIETVSLPIFGALPAGWPQTREGVAARRPARSVAVRRGRFPEGAFGLEVRGDSMNAARPVAFFDRDIVVLLSPEQRPPQHDDVVAALIDGETCLKRLKMRKGRSVCLQSESTNPAHGVLHPAHDLVIQGVCVGKLDGE